MARSTLTSVGCLALALALSISAHADKKPTEELRARADKASPQDCAKVCLEAAKQLVDDGSQQISNGDTATGIQTLRDALRYAENGARGSISSHKRLKNAEIDVREVIRRLTNIKQTLDAEQRGAMDEEIVQLEKLRDELLAAMFGNPNKFLERR